MLFRSETTPVRLIPLKLYISAQNGRQHLLAFCEDTNCFRSYRLDYLANIRLEDTVCKNFDTLRTDLQNAEAHIWGVNCKSDLRQTEHVEFEIYVAEEEGFILRRLEREKRCGRIEQCDEHHYRYIADVFDTVELLPWIRTFLSRITSLNFSNKIAEQRFRADILEMYRMYGIDGGDEHDFQ